MDYKLDIINSTPELELLSKMAQPHGFKVLVKFSSPRNTEQVYRNITEVHWKYKSIYPSGMGLALESNIHSTGFTHDVNNIEQVTVEIEKEIMSEI